MNWILEALQWIGTGDNWLGPDGIAVRIGQQLAITAIVCLCAALIAVPIGILVGHTRRGMALVLAVSGGLRALPTLGILTLFALWLGIGLQAPILALIVLAVPPMLTGVYAGIQSVSRDVVSASRALGFGTTQLIALVELPLALPSIWQGARSMVLQVISTATLAAYVGAGGLGSYIFLGLKSRDYGLMLAGSILVIGLALLGELAFSLAGRVLVPSGVRALQGSEPAEREQSQAR